MCGLPNPSPFLELVHCRALESFQVSPGSRDTWLLSGSVQQTKFHCRLYLKHALLVVAASGCGGGSLVHNTDDPTAACLDCPRLCDLYTAATCTLLVRHSC